MSAAGLVLAHAARTRKNLRAKPCLGLSYLEYFECDFEDIVGSTSRWNPSVVRVCVPENNWVSS